MEHNFAFKYPLVHRCRRFVLIFKYIIIAAYNTFDIVLSALSNSANRFAGPILIASAAAAALLLILSRDVFFPEREREGDYLACVRYRTRAGEKEEQITFYDRKGVGAAHFCSAVAADASRMQSDRFVFAYTCGGGVGGSVGNAPRTGRLGRMEVIGSQSPRACVRLEERLKKLRRVDKFMPRFGYQSRLREAVALLGLHRLLLLCARVHVFLCNLCGDCEVMLPAIQWRRSFQWLWKIFDIRISVQGKCMRMDVYKYDR